MLHYENQKIRELLFKGNFGLEKENLRVRHDGTNAKSPHPFPEDSHIVRDFSENQLEINTDVYETAEEALEALGTLTDKVQRRLAGMQEPELLWPFSNPAYIRDEDDIPIARFFGNEAEKTAYREYLSDRYGRYKMALSGIHVNFSFSQELLYENAGLEGEDFQKSKNQLYVSLAEKLAACGWILTACTAASPVLDSSYSEKGVFGKTSFYGLASIRDSELGYWNAFTPILDYTDIGAYADSIENYIRSGTLRAATELYYPVRLKPKGENSPKGLKETGADHIELRMFDLNPCENAGIQLYDLKFAHLLMIYLSSVPVEKMTWRDQVQAVQNFKYAAHYDLKTVKIVLPDGKACPVAQAALDLIRKMKTFYRDFPSDIQKVLSFEENKFIDADKRYAWKIRKDYAEYYVDKGLQLAVRQQQEALKKERDL